MMLKTWLKRILLIIVILLLAAGMGIGALLLYFHQRNSQPFGAMRTPAEPGRLGKYVQPFIGTGGYFWVCGNNYPGASAPFGVVRLSPDTESSVFRKKALNTSGYYFPDNRIIGFSHTRLSGTGATDGGHFRVVPAVGNDCWQAYLEGHYCHYSHEYERAFPGYYAVRLEKPEVLAELTSTPRTGIHRYTFPAGAEPHLLVDICSILGDKRVHGGSVRIDPENSELEGEVTTSGTFSGRYGGIKVFFFASFDSKFSSFTLYEGMVPIPGEKQASGKNLGVDIGFNPGTTVGLRLGISHVSVENARQNLETEAADKDFDSLVREAVNRWESKLSLVEAEFNNDKDRTIFYTALYRSFQMPTLFQDVNGEYTGFDKKTHRAEGFNYYTDLSLWDTFRTLHPLYMLLAPDAQRDMVVSLIRMKEQGGWLPRWPSGCGYTGSMLGSPADMVISESWQKGIRDFDVMSAYEGMKYLALNATPRGARFGGRSGIEEYNQYGYCPTDLMDKAVSRTLEYGWADHAIAILADSLGLKEDAALFYWHASFYRNLWNPATRFFQSRDSRGNFTTRFNPLKLSYFDTNGKYTKDYVEGSGMQWRFAVPYDPAGMIGLFGGAEAFASDLNRFFENSDPAMSNWNPGSWYWHGNEPDIHAAFLFNEAGRPDLTQKWSRWILENKYDVTSDGLDGNDDGATLSSWYLFTALGFYPIAGSDYYEISSPLVKNAVLHLGKSNLMINVKSASPGNRYISKIRLNGQEILPGRIKHSQIAVGGLLEFEMDSHPPGIRR